MYVAANDIALVVCTVVEPGRPALKLIVENFGSDVLLPSGHLDRAKVGRIIFEDESKRRVLNRSTHPFIRRAMIMEAIKYFFKGSLINVVSEK